MSALKYGKLTTFHCQKCGSGITLADGKCAYCHESTTFRKKPNELVRVFIEIDPQTRFYFHQVQSVESMGLENECIDVTNIDDAVNKYITRRNLGDIRFECLLTKDTVFKEKYIEEKMNKSFNVFFEMDSIGQVFKVSADSIQMGMPNISMNEFAKIDIDLRIHNYDGMVDKNKIYTVPDDKTCPNCGAKLKKHFGLCDYCGGWVEFDDYFRKEVYL